MKLLFICTHNRCRSILAEAITNHLCDGKIIAASAGSSPEGQVHPLSLLFLNERNINTDNLNSQSWHEFEDFKPDAILTMCDSAAAESCPIWFNQSIQVHWGLQDPSRNAGSEDKQRDSFNRTMDIIERRINALLEAQSKNKTQTLSGANLSHVLTTIAQQIN